MAVQYQAIFRDTSGDKQAVVTDFLSLAYTKRTGAKAGAACSATAAAEATMARSTARNG